MKITIKPNNNPSKEIDALIETHLNETIAKLQIAHNISLPMNFEVVVTRPDSSSKATYEFLNVSDETQKLFSNSFNG
ncbi:MAG: hypothetical protein RIQ33_2365 [Bacteroidota bacterium]